MDVWFRFKTEDKFLACSPGVDDTDGVEQTEAKHIENETNYISIRMECNKPVPLTLLRRLSESISGICTSIGPALLPATSKPNLK